MLWLLNVEIRCGVKQQLKQYERPVSNQISKLTGYIGLDTSVID